VAIGNKKDVEKNMGTRVEGKRRTVLTEETEGIIRSEGEKWVEITKTT